MSSTQKNGILSLEELFEANNFQIPQYQRAYSWVEDPHLEAFLEDLRQQAQTQTKDPEKSYFLGTLLLHEEVLAGGNRVVNIVDGQQRMTTSVVFIATALALNSAAKISINKERAEKLKGTFIRDHETDRQKFKTIIEDGPFFSSQILKIANGPPSKGSPSSTRLLNARTYFEKHIGNDEWERLIEVLCNAKVMVYSVASAADATQIFELQNDRGKQLTSLEALKSYLMHCIYLHSLAQGADDKLAVLQTQFSTIYRSVEELEKWEQAPDENQLLSNHCAAFLPWTSTEYRDPKHMVKAIIKKMNGTAAVSWIENFVGSLVQSFKSIEDLFKDLDKLPEFSQLLLLGRMGSIWPLVLKTWKPNTTTIDNKRKFLKTCRLLEVFTFRGYAIAGLRSDTAQSTFLTIARDFQGDFDSLHRQITQLCFEYDLEKRFVEGLNNSHFYEYQGRDALYLLWRYENHLRSQVGKQASPSPWRDFLSPNSHAEKLSVEHIAAQGNALSDTVVEWDDGQPKPFKEVALHRLGNLVLDSVSANASKGKKDFHLKLKTLMADSTYLSQGELITFLKAQDVLIWDVDAIRKRHICLTEFAMKTWHPVTCFSS